MNVNHLDRIFITGGPRSGTTIFQAIIVAMGYLNASKDLDIGNGEDICFNRLINYFNDNSIEQSKESYLDGFDSYFSSLWDDQFLNHKPICLKYPMLMGLPVADPKITMLVRPYYEYFISSILKNFDKLIYVERDWQSSLKSEIQRKPWIAKNASSLEHFTNEYKKYHFETFNKIISIAESISSETKIYRFYYNDLLENPSIFLSKVKVILNLLKPNDLYLHTEEILINFIKTKKLRAAPGLTNTMVTLLGHINYLKSLRQDNKIDLKEFRSALKDTVNSIRGINVK